MSIKQISIFVENKPGALYGLTGVLAQNKVDLRALSLAETSEFGIVRIILRSEVIDRAMALLKGAGYTARINHVICAEIVDKPNGLCELLTVIEKENLSVEYIYSFRRTPARGATMILRLSEQDRACKVLKEYGVRVLTQEEADAL